MLWLLERCQSSQPMANTLHSTKSCFCTVMLKLYIIRMSFPLLTKLYSAKFGEFFFNVGHEHAYRFAATVTYI